MQTKAQIVYIVELESSAKQSFQLVIKFKNKSNQGIYTDKPSTHDTSMSKNFEKKSNQMNVTQSMEKERNGRESKKVEVETLTCRCQTFLT